MRLIWKLAIPVCFAAFGAGFNAVWPELGPGIGYTLMGGSALALIVIAWLHRGQWDKLFDADYSVAPTQPDWSIADLFRYINPHVVEDEDYHRIEKMVMDRLARGELRSWGRLPNVVGQQRPPTEIPANSWQTSQMSLLFLKLLKEPPHVDDVHVYSGNGHHEDLKDLMVSSHQAKALFSGYEARDASDKTLHWLFGLIVIALVFSAVAMGAPEIINVLGAKP